MEAAREQGRGEGVTPVAFLLEAFSAKLRDQTDMDTLNSELLSTVRETIQPEHVSLWLREPERKVE